MSFSSARVDDIAKVGAGERYGQNLVILSSDNFEDELKVGRFAKLDTGRLDNIDASATPVIAGVVLRNVASAIEDGDTIDGAIHKQAEYMRQGLVTVDVVAADTPAQFGAVFVKNTADADAGKATTVNDATTEAADAEFIKEVDTDVWLIRLK